MPSKVITALPGFTLWLLLAVGYALYLPGQHGMFNFDDSVNLKGLADVQDGWTALRFPGHAASQRSVPTTGAG